MQFRLHLITRITEMSMYNDLPNELKSAPSHIAFKSGLQAVDLFKYLKGASLNFNDFYFVLLIRLFFKSCILFVTF